MKKQYTVRGVDAALDRAIREAAAEYGVSVNKAAVTLLRKATGLETAPGRAGPPYDDLGDLAGSLTREEGAAILKDLRRSRKTERGIWRTP